MFITHINSLQLHMTIWTYVGKMSDLAMNGRVIHPLDIQQGAVHFVSITDSTRSSQQHNCPGTLEEKH